MNRTRISRCILLLSVLSLQGCATVSELFRTLTSLDWRLLIDAQPSVSTPLGDITYPERITIISKEFR